MYLVIVATLSKLAWNVDTSAWGNQIVLIYGSVAMTNLYGNQFPYSPYMGIQLSTCRLQVTCNDTPSMQFAWFNKLMAKRRRKYCGPVVHRRSLSPIVALLKRMLVIMSSIASKTTLGGVEVLRQPWHAPGQSKGYSNPYR